MLRLSSTGSIKSKAGNTPSPTASARPVFAPRARAANIRFFDQTVTEAGTVWYYDKSAGDWRSQTLGDGLYASPVVVVELASGQTYFLALPRTFAMRENGSREHFPDRDGVLRTTKLRSGGVRITMDGYGLAPDCVTDALDPDRTVWAGLECG